MKYAITVYSVVVTMMFWPALLCAQEAETDLEIFMPSFSELTDGWNTLKPGGETRCALGGEFEFYVHPGSSEKLMIYMYGGGACSNAETCDPDRVPGVGVKSITDQHNPGNRQSVNRTSGILDENHPENPFLDYTLLAIPYCTADVYFGNRDVEYQLEDEKGNKKTFTIYHRGTVNMQAVLDWIYDNIESPKTIFVSGTSAGGIATPYYSRLLAKHYPQITITGLSDDVGSYSYVNMKGSNYRIWGVPETLEGMPGLWEDGVDTPDLFIKSKENIPNLRLYQIDHAHDQRQKYWAELNGAEDPDISFLIQTNREKIALQIPSFRGYTSGGIVHGVLRENLFYRQHTNGHRVRDWVAALAAGEAVDNVQCQPCNRPGFIYEQYHIKAVNHALELLSSPEKWNPYHDMSNNCAGNEETYTMPCAVVSGIQKYVNESPVSNPVFWDLVYSSIDRLGKEYDWTAPVNYNNRPDAHWEEIVYLLKEVRERISAGIESNRTDIKNEIETEKQSGILNSEGALHNLYTRIDSIRTAAGAPAAQVAVLLPDTTILWNFGFADPRTEEPVVDETMFRVGSVSKSFAGISMLMLVERNLVRLDDKLHELAPELNISNPWQDERPVLLSHLLEAGAGFPGFHQSDYLPADPPEMELSQAIAGIPYKLESRWPPGEYTAYHNIGPALTAYLVEKITGQRYEDFVQQQIFEPLGMNQSSFFRTETVKTRLVFVPWSEQYITRARQMGLLGDNEEPDDFYTHIRFRPAGALNTRAKELAAFVRMLMNRGEYMGSQLLKPETVDRFETSTSTVAARKLGISLGHGVNNWASVYNDVVYFGHGGSVPPSFTAWYSYSPITGTGFVYLGARGENGDALHHPVVNQILRYLHPEPNPGTYLDFPEAEISKLRGCYLQVNPDRIEQPLLKMNIDGDVESVVAEVISADGRNLGIRSLEPWKYPGTYRLIATETEQQSRPWDDILTFVIDDSGEHIAQFLSWRHRAFKKVSCDDGAGNVNHEKIEK